jgi:arylsulfatase A-like enzyme
MEGWAPLSYGYPFGEDAYRDYLRRGGLPSPIAVIEWSDRTDYPRGMKLDLTEADDWFGYGGGMARLEAPVETHEAHFVADLADRWIRDAAREGRPWFVRVDPWGPHPPYLLDSRSYESIDQTLLPAYPNLDWDLAGRPPHHRDYRDLWRKRAGFDIPDWRRMRARAYEHAGLVDRAMGRLIDTLAELNLLETTAVFYTTDHGDIMGTNGGCSNKGPLMVEENVRVPMACSIPGIAPDVRVRDHIVTNMDLFSTALDLAGIEIPRGIESRSLLPLYRDPRTPWRDEVLMEHHGMRTPQFQRTLLSDHLKYTIQADGFEELYRLDQDAWEMENLIGEPGHQGMLDRCRSRLAARMTETRDDSPEAKALLDRLASAV